MDLYLILLSVLEGITEFLPVSSTAHLILLSKFLNVDTTDSYIKFYLLFIQMGALFAGMIIYLKKIFSDKRIFINLCVSFIPSAVVGFIFYKLFKQLLEGNMILIAITMAVGGLIFIYLEKIYIKKYSKQGLDSFGKDEVSILDAFVIGLAQAVAIIPGVSRSGATIIAGILRKIKKSTIIEYTFLLAVPTLGAAVVYDAYKTRDVLLKLHSWDDLLIGFGVSLLVAVLVILFLKKHLNKISLTAFGYYRILIAILILSSIFLTNTPVVKDEEIVEKVTIAPSLIIKPSIVYPGDPVMLVINASSTPEEVKYDNKKIPTFVYKDHESAFIAIPFEETKMEHMIRLTLSNGMIINEPLTLTPRERIEKPLGIPEKLGGNTKQAGQSLVDNLAKENVSINNIKTENTSLWTKTFVKPLESVFITDDYGYNRDTVGFLIAHKGTDFRAAIGTPVMAMNDGIVRVARLYTVYGNTVIIDHGLGLSTLYMHMSELKVKEGDIVKAGDIIGLSGKTGYADAAHLHLSIKIGGISIDPAKFMAFFDVI